MDSNICWEINKKALEKVQNLVPDFNKYSIGKTFTELYNEDAEFVQVDYYDRTSFDKRWSDKGAEIIATPEDAEKLIAEIDRYNEALAEAQKEYAEAELDSYDQRTYFSFHRVKTDIGICHVRKFERNRTREEKKRKEEAEEHARLMREDPAYREEYEWHNKEYRPFGGAFSSQEEYLHYRTGLSWRD